MPLVDVVIVNYNAGPYLRRAIHALQEQTFRDFRIIIVDNASTDNSLSELPTGDVDVKVVRIERNLGFAAGNNVAISHYVDAEWVALLNPDAFPRPEWLERLLRAAAADPTFTFFGCKMLDASDNARLDGVGDVFHVSGLHWREGHGCLNSSTYGHSTEIFAPCAAAALYRVRDVMAVGGFDEDFFCYSEDVDLGFRLRLAGHRCLYVADAEVEHVGSGITGTHSDFSLYHGHRNLVWTYVKNVPAPYFWIYLPYHILLNVCSLCVFTLRRRGTPVWRAKRDALLKLPYFWRKRRVVQAIRRVPAASIRRYMQGGLPTRSCK
ncbi:MAG TPA: glycosyltransferase family 2 protein [Burkholderiales bacterium]|nr:glycosyltransferase family 2 protein [Burkholderiales bacterium]